MSTRIVISTFVAGVALVGAFTSAATAAPSKPVPTGAQQCFWARDINSFAAQDDATVNVRVGVNDVYQLNLFSPSPDVDWTQRIGIESRGSSWICSGLDATLIIPSPIGPQRYPVTSIKKLTTAEVAALPKRAKP